MKNTRVPSSDPAVGASTRDPAAAVDGARPVVWILDDSPVEGAMARRALVPVYEVETFVDGSTLLERAAAGTGPSVLVLDWQLPGMSGIEVCRFLRSTRDEMELPILMLTGYGHKGDLVDGLNAGANDYLTKPYDAPELAARVATLARIRALHDVARRAERRTAELLSLERIARGEAEAANQAKDEFLAMVSHELRTPLNAILGWTRILRGGGLGEKEVTKALATVERNAVAQTKLIDDLMDMSRILSGKLQIETQPLELVSIIQASVDAVELPAKTKGVTMRLRVADDAGQIQGDPPRIQQVISNLLTNAIKFTPTGGRVDIALERDGGDVCVSVADSGAGIAAEFLPHVFERFRQGNVGAKRAHGGLGLGLAIVKHIVEAHEGKVQARSAGPGHGATFLVSFPRTRASAESADLSSGSPQLTDVTDTSRLRDLRVLILDDDADAVDLLATMLDRHGAVVIKVTSATAALAAIADAPPDVLVSDIAMPTQDGYELIARVRALPSERGGRTPALALTAFAGPDDRARALTSGFDSYASKPIEPVKLVDEIVNLARRPEARRG